MRIIPSLCARSTPKEPVPFKAIIPLTLKPQLSGKGDGNSSVSCLHELSILFACLKKNEFNEATCSKEIDTFQSCYVNNLKYRKVQKDREAKGILTPGEKKLSHKQLNILMRQYPNIK